MKKAICVLLSAIMMLSLAACSGGKPASSDSASDNSSSDVQIDIKESNFVSYINEIYTNRSDYEGKVIRLQGMFSYSTDSTTGKTYYFVYRNGEGCACGCGSNWSGFEFTWDGVDTLETGDWIDVIGTLEVYYEGDSPYLNIKAQSVTPTEAGASTVTL